MRAKKSQAHHQRFYYRHHSHHEHYWRNIVLVVRQTRRDERVQYIVYNLLRTDPIGAYVETKRLIRLQKIKVKSVSESEADTNFLMLLEHIYGLLGETSLINDVQRYLPGWGAYYP